MFEALAVAIDELEIGVDERELAAAATLRDRLDAKLALAVADFDEAELWDLDGSTSMAAWLRIHTGMTQREGMRLSYTARRLRGCPLTAHAWVEGELSGGQVAAIVANVTDELLPLYVERERAVLLALRDLDQPDSTTYMRRWAARAKAELERLQPEDAPEPEAPPSAVYLSPMLDGRGRLDGDLDSETYDLLRTALRLAETRDVDGEPVRAPSHRRADALAALCRHFLDHQQVRSGGRHRPHVNVVIDLDQLLGDGLGRSLDGLPLDAASMRRLLCDAGIHRVITRGRSSILDYGHTTRTIPPGVYTSLLLRDLGCRFPGCDRPGEWCEGHHVTHWEQGGPTCMSNLVLFCSRHHHRVHLKGWEVKLLPTGTVKITNPEGLVRTSDPPLRC